MSPAETKQPRKNNETKRHKKLIAGFTKGPRRRKRRRVPNSNVTHRGKQPKQNTDEQKHKKPKAGPRKARRTRRKTNVSNSNVTHREKTSEKKQ